MKAIALYFLAVCWCSAWFLGCGDGGTSVNVNQTQNVNQDPEPCRDCVGTFAQVEACLEQYGMLPEDCGKEEEEE